MSPRSSGPWSPSQLDRATFGLIVGPKHQAASAWQDVGGRGSGKLVQSIGVNQPKVGGAAKVPCVLYNSDSLNDYLITQDNITQNFPLQVTLGWNWTATVGTIWVMGSFCQLATSPTAKSANPWTHDGLFHDSGAGIFNLGLSDNAGTPVATSFWWRGAVLETPVLSISLRQWYIFEMWKQSDGLYLRIGSTTKRVADPGPGSNLTGVTVAASAPRLSTAQTYSTTTNGVHVASNGLVGAKAMPGAAIRGSIENWLRFNTQYRAI